MKNQLVFTCFFTFCYSFTAFGQSEFGALGTKWTYTEDRPTVPPPGSHWPYVLESESEVLIQGLVCKKLVGGQGFPEELIYIRTEGDSVFWWNAATQQFYLLYDFSAQPGDSWAIDMWPNTDGVGMSVFTLHVDSTGYEIWEGDSLRVWYVSYSGYEAYWGVRYLEKVGSPCFFTPVAGNFDRPICGLRCFEAPPATDYIFVDYPCDTVYTAIYTGIAEDADEKQIKVYPNPASRRITLDCSLYQDKILHLELFDPTGKRIYFESFNNDGSSVFEVSNIENGLYYLRLSHGEQALKHFKISVVH